MLDRFALPLLSRPLHATAAVFLKFKVTANAVTIAGLFVGFSAAAAVVFSLFDIALALILCNRFLDGVDGVMARSAGPTHRGAFLDIVCDFLFYAAIPLAFAVQNPSANALAAAALLAAFVGTGATFLAFAAVSAKAGQDVNPSYPNKAIFYLGGLTEGTETIITFCLMCLFHAYFAVIAYVFASACVFTIVSRLWMGTRRLP